MSKSKAQRVAGIAALKQVEAGRATEDVARECARERESGIVFCRV
jgi:hypothetical protein